MTRRWSLKSTRRFKKWRAAMAEYQKQREETDKRNLEKAKLGGTLYASASRRGVLRVSAHEGQQILLWP